MIRNAHHFTVEELANAGFKETILTLAASNGRVMLLRSTNAHQYVVRIVSSTAAGFDFVRAAKLLEADIDASTIAVFGKTMEGATRLAERYVPVGVGVLRFIYDEMDPQYKVIHARHAKETGDDVREQIGFKIPRPLSAPKHRILDRLGPTGYDLLTAQSVLSGSRSAVRVAAQTLLAFRAAKAKKKGRDGLVALQLGWNLVTQAYVALENLAALYESVRATNDGDYSAFASTFLRFGRTDKLAQHTVQNTFQRLGGADGEKDLRRTFGVPYNRGHLKDVGLDGCAVDPDSLVAIGRGTIAMLGERFRRLGELVVFDASPSDTLSYDPRKAMAKRAYDALHHGFALVLPVLAPYPQVVAVHGGFVDEDDFAQGVRDRDFGGLMLDLDPATGTTSRIIAPATVDQLKPFANAVALATTMHYELTKYAQDKFSSVNGRMPYLINASLHLTQDEYRQLHGCLDHLLGKEIPA